MKKILFLLWGIWLTASGCLANQFPINVYVEEHPYKPTVVKAFSEWERAGGDAVRFRYVRSPAQLPNLIVVFSDSSDRSENHKQAVGLISTKAQTGIGTSAKANITIWLRASDNTKMSDKQIYHICLHEIGHALGLSHTQNKNDIMYPYVNEQTTLSENDINRFRAVFGK